MKHISYGHHRGDKVLPAKLSKEIIASIEACTLAPQKGAATRIKDDILGRLQIGGWSPEVVIDSGSKISITSVKDKVGLCFQTGNMCRMYADLIKLQTVYLRGMIETGVLIVLTKHAARVQGENIANFDRLKGELTIFDRVITVPLLVVGIE